MPTTAASIGAAISAAAGTVNESRIEVTDGSGATRVWLGALGAGEYGLKVVSSDGSTVIIDGTSNMFKILASGTMSVTAVASTMAVITEVTLSALGTFTEIPASLSWVAQASGRRNQPPYVNEAGIVKFAATTSGGSPTSPSGTFDTLVRTSTTLDGSNFVKFAVEVSNATAGNLDYDIKYYILAEAAI